jgi:1,4-dihydroxy-2-naphthoate octaprenyltransferase
VLFIRASRPLLWIGVILTYWLGAGIAKYLGETIDADDYLLGQAWVIALLLGGVYLDRYYAGLSEPAGTRNNPHSGEEDKESQGINPVNLLVAGAAALAAAASLTVLILERTRPSPPVLLIMGLAFLAVIAYAVPPLRLVWSGYGELVAAFLIANLTPALSFLFQTGELHRLLAMSTFPLTALCMAAFLVFQLSEYLEELKSNRRTLLVRLGWQRGMVFHNAMILVAFLLMALALTFRLPLFIGLPAFLSLPLGVLQIWQMRRIADGAKPNWQSLRLTAIVLFATTAYLTAYAYWTR